jgi:hypothetical protein
METYDSVVQPFATRGPVCIIMQQTWRPAAEYKNNGNGRNKKVTLFIHSSKVRPLYIGFPSPKTKFRHLSLSLVSSSVSPWFVMLRLTTSIHRSLGLPILRVPSGSHSKNFSGSLFPGILFTCPNNFNLKKNYWNQYTSTIMIIPI